jgi:membrane protein DedA with SNARE-associated domain
VESVISQPASVRCNIENNCEGLSMIEHLAVYFTYAIRDLGYLGAAFLMTLESMVVPVPSELVMPFVGFLVAEGQFSPVTAIFATSLGSVVGSLISYCAGHYGGRPFVLKVGRYVLLNREHLEFTERWFARHGSWTIFVSRFIPVVRHLISVPAGAGRMNIGKFCLYTIIGATAWNSFLLLCGYKLRQNWVLVQRYTHELDLAVAAMLAIVVAWFIMTHIRRSRTAAAVTDTE